MTRILITALLSASILTANSQHLTILHSNDTHSQIDPTDAPEDLGGVIRRKAIIDSVRNATPNPVMLIDAGDAVQGTMFFTLFGGEVEQKLLNHLGYDIQILGNHEFDNGMERLAANLRNAKPVVLSTNYDVDSTALRGLIRPYYVREIMVKNRLYSYKYRPFRAYRLCKLEGTTLSRRLRCCKCYGVVPETH